MEGDLFLPPLEPSSAAQPVFFRKGLIISFTPSTGANIVRVGGVNVPDLPILVSGAETALQPGQTVGILVTGNTMFIIGRVVNPGSAGYASTASAFTSVTANAQAFTLIFGFTIVVTNVLQVPAWASKAIVVALTTGAFNNNWANSINLQARIIIPGGPAINDIVQSAGANAWTGLDYSAGGVVAVTPGGTLTTRLEMGVAPGPVPVHADNGVTMTSTAIFTTA